MKCYMENSYGTTLLHSLHGPEQVLLLLRAVGNSLSWPLAKTFFILFSYNLTFLKTSMPFFSGEHCGPWMLSLNDELCPSCIFTSWSCNLFWV